MQLSPFIGDLGSSILGAAYEYRLPFAIVSVAGLVAVLLVARRRGWFTAAQRHPVATSVVMVGALVFAVPVAWYLVSPVFISTELDEPAPVMAVVAPASAPTTASPGPSIAPTVPAPATAPPTPAPPTPAPTALRSGTFTGTDDFHFGRGTVTLLETTRGEFTLRFEDFAVRNGPDLYVYLSPKRDAYTEGAIEIARLKADTGSFNQRIPPGTDLSGVRSVLIWCKQFSHLFAVAPLEG